MLPRQQQAIKVLLHLVSRHQAPLVTAGEFKIRSFELPSRVDNRQTDAATPVYDFIAIITGALFL